MTDTAHEACYYRVDEGDTLRCLLCPQLCVIRSGRSGICRSRQNSGGKLILTNYGRYTSLAVDPIEKKPLYHFHPGSGILSIGGMGCNFTCRFCQNWGIAQGDPETYAMSPEALAGAQAAKAGQSIGVAFTYNEPFIWFEYIRDAAPLLRRDGAKIVLVTNCFINTEPLEELLPLVDAMNIDLKSFNEAFYKKYCGGKLEPVKENIKRCVAAGKWVELTCLVIPKLNDSESELDEMASWIASVGKDIPLHLSRYFPNYMHKEPPTPMETLRKAHEIAKRHLNYVYLGNVEDFDAARTLCPSCGEVAVARLAYRAVKPGLTPEGNCAACGAKLAFVL
jgi:pyruvate formate lyase activating enzyme